MANIDKIRSRIQLSVQASLDFSGVRQKWSFDHSFSSGYLPEFVSTPALNDPNKITKLSLFSAIILPNGTYDHDFFVDTNNPVPSTGAPQVFTKVKFIVIQPIGGPIKLASSPLGTINGFGIASISSTSGLHINPTMPLVLSGESVDIDMDYKAIRLINPSSVPRTFVLLYGGD